MKFEEILPKFRNGVNIARRKWINAKYPQRWYIYIKKVNGQEEIMAVDKYGEYISYLDAYELLADDWVIVRIYDEGEEG